MKVPKLQDILTWKGKLYEVVGLGHDPFVDLKSIEDKKCPHCKRSLGKECIDGLVISSPHFQENVKPVNTIEENNVKLK